MNKRGDISGLIALIILGLAAIATFTFLSYSTLGYWELKQFIDNCNKDLGVGNWTFTEDKEHYSCKAYNQQSYIISSTVQSQTCFSNGIQINCSSIQIP